MVDKSDEASPQEPAQRAEGTPIANFTWSDGVVGMGFFPEEVDLPAGWTWEAARVRP